MATIAFYTRKKRNLRELIEESKVKFGRLLSKITHNPCWKLPKMKMLHSSCGNQRLLRVIENIG